MSYPFSHTIYCGRRYIHIYVWINICLTLSEGVFIHFSSCPVSHMCNCTVLGWSKFWYRHEGGANFHLDYITSCMILFFDLIHIPCRCVCALRYMTPFLRLSWVAYFLSTSHSLEVDIYFMVYRIDLIPW